MTPRKYGTPSHITSDMKPCIKDLIGLVSLHSVMYGQHVYKDTVDGGVLRDMAVEIEAMKGRCMPRFAARGESNQLLDSIRDTVVKMAGPDRGEGGPWGWRLSGGHPVEKADLDKLQQTLNSFEDALLFELEESLWNVNGSRNGRAT